MSWWTKNRKKLGLGLLGGAAVASGAGALGLGPLAGLLGGEGAAAGLVGGTAGVGPVASGVEYGLLAGGTNPLAAKAAGMGSSAMNALGSAGKAAGAVNAVGMMDQQPQQPPAPPPPPAAPMPQSSFTGYGMQGDPFAGMSEEQKRRILAMIQQGGMR